VGGLSGPLEALRIPDDGQVLVPLRGGQGRQHRLGIGVLGHPFGRDKAGEVEALEASLEQRQ